MTRAFFCGEPVGGSRNTRDRAVFVSHCVSARLRGRTVEWSAKTPWTNNALCCSGEAVRSSGVSERLAGALSCSGCASSMCA